jgi:hypothetical protein
MAPTMKDSATATTSAARMTRRRGGAATGISVVFWSSSKIIGLAFGPLAAILGIFRRLGDAIACA